MKSACVAPFHMLQHGQCMQPKHSLSSLIVCSITMASNSEKHGKLHWKCHLRFVTTKVNFSPRHMMMWAYYNTPVRFGKDIRLYLIFLNTPMMKVYDIGWLAGILLHMDGIVIVLPKAVHLIILINHFTKYVRMYYIAYTVGLNARWKWMPNTTFPKHFFLHVTHPDKVTIWQEAHRFESSQDQCDSWFCLHFWPS